MRQGSLFAWLHLSDIHIGHGGASHRADQELVLRKLREDVAAQIKAGIPKPDVVLVTGDIAFSGACRDPDEYKRAAAWLKTVADTIGVGLESVYVVPGNHDVQWSVDETLGAKTLLKALRREEPHLDEALHDVETRKHLAARQANYLAFAQGLAPAGRSEAPDAPRLFWQHTREARGGLRVRLCGLNTALLAAEEKNFGTDKGALWLGKRQIAEVLPGSPEEGEVVIVLSHHPFSEGWLHDEKNARAWTRSNADIHLSGHVHDADNEQTISGAGGGFVHIAAAATHGEAVPEWVPAQHGYSFGALVAEGDGVVLRVWPRRWSDKLKKFLRNGETIDESAGCATHTIKRVKLSREALDSSKFIDAFRPVPPVVPEVVRSRVDVAVLTVIAAELEAAKGVFKGFKRSETRQKTIVYEGTLFSAIGRRELHVVLACVGTAGNSAATATTTEILMEYQPRAVMLMGIAGGIRGKVRIGEVVIADRVVAYEPAASARQGRRSVLQPRPEIDRTPYEMSQRVASYQKDLDRLRKRFKAAGWAVPTASPGLEREFDEHVATSVDFHVGTIASGEKLWRDPVKFNALRKIHGRIEAGDMESAGLVEACRRTNVPWLVVRGISDFGDEFKDDRFHAFASQAAATVLVDFITHEIPVEEEGPAPPDPVPGPTPPVFQPDEGRGETRLSDPPRGPIPESVARAEAQVRAMLDQHPHVVASLERQGLGATPAAIAYTILEVRKALDVMRTLNLAFADLEKDPGASADDQRLLRSIFNECLRFATDWRAVLSTGRDVLRRGENTFELPISQASIAELILAGIYDKLPLFDPSRPNAAVGLTLVNVPPILRAAVAPTRERILEATVKHLAGTVFSDNPALDLARAYPASQEAIRDVEDTLHELGFRGASDHERPYYIVFNHREPELWQTFCDATRDKLPSLQLVRCTGGRDAGLVTQIQKMLRSQTKS